MPTITGSFSGKVKLQTTIAVPDQFGHELVLAEIGGTQKSSDANWNNATISYWGMMDLIEGHGSQRGYFVNNHGGGDHDWGTFEGKVATSGGQIAVEGTYQNTGGSGRFKGLSGKGTFKTKMTLPKDVEATWQGTYELAAAKAQAN